MLSDWQESQLRVIFKEHGLAGVYTLHLVALSQMDLDTADFILDEWGDQYTQHQKEGVEKICLELETNEPDLKKMFLIVTEYAGATIDKI